MTRERAGAYRRLLKTWVDGLTVNHPHTLNHAKRPNIHVAFHIYDFLLSFGPIISWWCFPFERVIGYLQRIHTTNRVGGELEATLTNSFLRGAALRRWLCRPDCPEVIKQFKAIFDRVFTRRSEACDTDTFAHDGEHAYYKLNGVTYSRASTHLGNSLILYYPSTSATSPVPGSIEKIVSLGSAVSFVVRPQEPLSPTLQDPFLRYSPYFPAKMYSSKMQHKAYTISPTVVLSHCARFQCSNDRAVIVNLARS
ncbi:hypothetical protein FB45DRAFT_767830 [Roridomyces roridus]|uniref:Uncharacterized protein n=1 Tax=Roridomyces roridus TaxID=1738132 RepID=A0AAD7AZ97_9AGAR|nr:hypothetical protein FB45DRAFT_767830 [Roridomyces roridus]